MPGSWPAPHRWISLADYPAEAGKRSFCPGCVAQYEVQTIPVDPQPDLEPPYEECCFCFTPTPLWTNLPDRESGEQVACCLECAQKRKREEVPTKQAWFQAAEKRRPNLRHRW